MDQNYLAICGYLLCVTPFAIGYVISSGVREVVSSSKSPSQGSIEKVDLGEARIRIEKQLQQLMYREAALKAQLTHLDVVERLAVEGV
jgi:hypothetical protein